MTKHLVVGCVVALAWLLAAPPALAAGTGGACKDDVKRLCSGVKRGGGAVSRCLNEHRKQLSKDCAAQRAGKTAKAKKGAATVKPWREACKDDVAKLCDGVKPGEGRVTACLLQHPKKLSGDCRAALDHGQARKVSFGKACGHDLAKYCSDTRSGRRNALKCLRQFQHDLSPACKAETGL